jgi:hypothetical protein
VNDDSANILAAIRYLFGESKRAKLDRIAVQLGTILRINDRKADEPGPDATPEPQKKDNSPEEREDNPEPPAADERGPDGSPGR